MKLQAGRDLDLKTQLLFIGPGTVKKDMALKVKKGTTHPLQTPWPWPRASYGSKGARPHEHLFLLDRIQGENAMQPRHDLRSVHVSQLQCLAVLALGAPPVLCRGTNVGVLVKIPI